MKINKRNMFLAAAATTLLGSVPVMALETLPGSDTVTPNAPGSNTVTVAGNANVQGTLTVQAAPAPVVVTPNPDNLGQQNAVAGTNNGTSTAFQTVLGGTTAAWVDATGGGAIIDNAGNATLNASTGTSNLVTVSRVTEARLFNADQGANAGQPVPGSQSYYLVDANGLEIVGSRVSVGDPGIADSAAALAAFEELIDGDGNGDLDFTSPDFAAATATVPLPATGGNLTVGGNATIAGTASTNGIDNNGETITGVADGVADDDAVNKGQLDAEEAARIADVDAEEARALAAEGVLDGKIDTEIADRIADVDAEEAARIADVDAEEARALAAEGVLDGKIDTEIADRIADVDAEEAARIADVDAEEARALAAEGVLDGKISDEAIRATSAENLLSGRITAETSARILADDDLLDRIQAEESTRAIQDNAIRNEFRSADQALGKRIDTNTRGIAMVAAMTNTTVQPGMKQAVDFNMAQFEGETGFAFGYSYRVSQNLQIQGAGASTTDLEESVVRLGMSYQW
jgi:hypothetical protein